VRLGRAIPLLARAARAGVLLAGLAAGCGGWSGGIHAVLRYRTSTHALLVEQVPPGGAAARAGLRANDEVLAIDGTPVGDLDADGVRARLRGEVGTRVRLHVRRDGEEQDVVIERAPYRNSQL
jgi:C-terminal processing protease CtpA/Prc